MELIEQIKETLQNVAHITGEKIDIAKLSMEIKALEDKQRMLYGDIGKIVYEEFLRGEESDLNIAELCHQIEENNKNIDKMSLTVLRLKSKKKCIDCGNILSLSDKFCNDCGCKQPVVEEDIPAETDNAEEAEIIEE